MIHEQIKNDLKSALKDRDEAKTSVLRDVISEFTNELIKEKRSRDELLDDEKAIQIMSRLTKQRKDSIEQFESGSRDDLAEKERKELEVIELYLPTMMDKGKIEEVVKKKAEELGYSDKTKMGDLMGAVMSELKGKANGADVKEVVEKVLS